MEVRGLREPLTKANVKIRDVYQAVDEDKNRRGAFSCSNDLINRLYAASLRSYRSNLQWGKPTDCVGRDERGGWTGDAEMQSQAGYYYTDMTAFYEQWLVDMRETQHSDGYIDNLAPRQGERAPAFEEDVAWSSVAVNVPWDMYNATGDKSVIEKQYESMKRFLDWCVATSNLGKGKEGGEDYTTNKDCWGDWGSDLEKGFCCPETRPEGSLFATAFFYQSARPACKPGRDDWQERRQQGNPRAGRKDPTGLQQEVPQTGQPGSLLSGQQPDRQCSFRSDGSLP